MRLITQRSEIKERMAAYLNARSSLPDDPLRKLDPETCTPEQFNEAAQGNAISPGFCSECGAEVWDYVEIGQEPDYESFTAYVCKSCLQKALALFDKESDPEG